MAGKAVISLTTGIEDAEKVTVAFLVAVGAAEAGRPTLMFQAKEAVRLGPARRRRSAWPATAARRWPSCWPGTRRLEGATWSAPSASTQAAGQG